MAAQKPTTLAELSPTNANANSYSAAVKQRSCYSKNASQAAWLHGVQHHYCSARSYKFKSKHARSVSSRGVPCTHAYVAAPLSRATCCQHAASCASQNGSTAMASRSPRMTCINAHTGIPLTSSAHLLVQCTPCSARIALNTCNASVVHATQSRHCMQTNATAPQCCQRNAVPMQGNLRGIGLQAAKATQWQRPIWNAAYHMAPSYARMCRSARR
jgi:hypothetical protein